jgi:hypothetical protein
MIQDTRWCISCDSVGQLSVNPFSVIGLRNTGLRLGSNCVPVYVPTKIYGPTALHALRSPDSTRSVGQFVCQTHWTSKDRLELRGLEREMGSAKRLFHKASPDLTGFHLTNVEQFQDLVPKSSPMATSALLHSAAPPLRSEYGSHEPESATRIERNTDTSDFLGCSSRFRPHLDPGLR